MQKYFSLEGNIGVGKSTFLEILKENLNIQAIFEPLDTWENIEGHNLLEKFYQDPKRWAYTFQNYAFITRVRDLTKSLNKIKSKTKEDNLIFIQERSVFSDRYCFAKNCYEQGLMTELEWNIYLDWFEWLSKLTLNKPSGFIYLRTTPEVSFKRITSRNRLAESNISLEYLEQLHNKHEDWLIKKENISDFIKDVPVLVLECNKDFKKDLDFQKDLINKVKNFIY